MSTESSRPGFIKVAGATAEVPGGNREHLADVAARMDRVLGL